MDQDLYGLQASGIDPEIAAQMLGLKRKRAVADALLQQSLSPLKADRVASGGIAVPISPWEGLAQMAKAYIGSKNMEDLDKQQGDLSKQNAAKVADAQMSYLQRRDGTPSQPIPDAGPGDAVDTTTTLNGRAPDKKGAVEFAMFNNLIKDSPIVKADFANLQPKWVGPDHSLMDSSGNVLGSSPKTLPPPKEVQKPEIQRLQEYAASLPQGSNERLQVQEQIRKLTTITKELPNININTPKPEVKLGPGERMTPEGNVELVPGTVQYNKQSVLHGKSFGALQGVETKMGEAMKKVDRILAPENKDGFNNNFGGYTALLTNKMTGNTATVKQEIESLKSSMKSAGMELFRSGGSIGQMTEREWPIVEKEIDSIDPTLDVGVAKAALQRVKGRFEKIMQNARDLYEQEWGGSQFAKKPKAESAAPPSSLPPDIANLVNTYGKPRGQ